MVYLKRDTVGAVSYNSLCHEREKESEREREGERVRERERLLGTLNYSHSFQERHFGTKICSRLYQKDTAGTLVYVKRHCWDSELQPFISRERLWGTLNYGRLCPERNKQLGTLNYNHLCQERERLWDPELQLFMSRDTLLGF